MLTQCFQRKKKREKCGIWLARARYLSYHPAITKLLPCNIHAFTSQYQCFSGDFPCFSGGKRPSFFRPFCNALTVRALQNERESRIYGRISLSGFHLLINWWNVQWNKKTPSLPPVRGRPDTFSACGFPTASARFFTLHSSLFTKEEKVTSLPLTGG